MVRFNLFILFFVMCLFLSSTYAQTVTGFLSRKPSSAAEGCGCTGCNDVAYAASVNYPDAAGVCGTTEPSGNSGSCSRLTKSRVIVIPSGCTVTAVGFMGDRAGCSGSTMGPGMDASDEFSITGSLGTVNGATGLMTGASNAQVTSPVITQVGGQLTFYLKSDRVAELLTYTITYATAGCTPSPLPLQLLSFTSDVDNEEINLKWSTAIEKNISSYDVEYSLDAINFSKQSSVIAAGNLYDVNHYNQIVQNNFNDRSVYFRLKINGKDDSYSYSPILSLKDVSNDNFSVSPNPTPTGDVVVNYPFRLGSRSILRILNSMGNTIYENNLNLPEDYIDLKTYGKGLYFFYLINNEKATIKKVVYQ